MARGKKKPVSFDAMVKFFMHHYKIPTTTDVEKLMERLDRLEKLLKQSQAAPRKRKAAKPAAAASPGRGKASQTYTDTVLQAITSSGKPVGVAEIQARTGFEPKKIRNIIFRLGKDGKIKRVGRGVYAGA
jgi:predicted Rossmann fold nucleotide-binding protein DprA/Smf involved in DNA uptake